MKSNEIPALSLSDLCSGLPGITPAFGECLAHAGAICLQDQRHDKGVGLLVNGAIDSNFRLFWNDPDQQTLRCWNDDEVTTEHGAYGVAILVVLNLTEYTVVKRSKKGTGFDFYLGRNDNEDLPFQNVVRLEISGIRRGADADVRARVRTKLRQTAVSDDQGPAFIVVVEFGKPLSMVAKK